jgi:hypothetical protein
MTATTPLKPPLAAGPPKSQKPPDNVAPKKIPEPDVQLFARALAERLPVEVTLHDGTTVTGHVRSYGQYTLEFELAGGERIVLYKNFIRSVRAGDAR